MSNPANITPPFEPVAAKQLLDQFAVSQAAELALSGNYGSAESLLKELVQRQDAPSEALDLLARISAQQGRLLEAAGLWPRALDKDPGNAAYESALARLNKLQSRPIWLQAVLPVALGALAVVCCIIILRWGARTQVVANQQFLQKITGILADDRRTADKQAEAMKAEIQSLASNQIAVVKTTGHLDADLAALSGIETRLDGLTSTEKATSQQIQAMEASAEAAQNQLTNLSRSFHEELAMLSERSRPTDPALGRQVADLASNYNALFARLVSATNPPQIIIGLPGIITRQSIDPGVLAFEDGLFDHGSHFKLGAKDRLTAVLKALAQSKERLSIEVVGYSDSDQGFFGPLDSYSLGLKRAATVVDFIRVSGFFSANQLKASSGGSTQLPFPSNSTTNMARNRTVVLKLTTDKPWQPVHNEP